ncbi:MAG TPA: S9 family peptidase [Vicinamibacterales bacterium]|nr:S9 family peptidase [Vicinamibacterales bacterium]
MLSKFSRRLFVIGLALLAAPGSAAAQKETLTHERLWAFKRVGGPVVSPDGQWVVFAVSEPSYDPQQEVSDLWIVPADGSAPARRLTSNRGAENGPAWSPDSTRLAFAARRDDDEVAQIYVLDVARGGEAQRVTNAPTAASAPRWSPDGRRLLFQASMWRGATDEESNRKAAQERKAAKSKARVYDTFPVRNWDRWLEEAKTHVWIVEIDGKAPSRSLLGGTTLAASPGFGGNTLGAVFAPDGQSVVFSAADQADRAARAMVVTHLWQVPVAGGEPVRLALDGWDVDGPVFRPDGRGLCFTMTDAKPAIYALRRLGCAAWPWTGAVTVVTNDLDRAVSSWTFAADGQSVYLTAEDAGHERIYTVPVAGGATKLLVDAPQGVYTGVQVARAGSTPQIVASWESAVSPAEIVRVDPGSGTRTFLSSLNREQASALDWLPLREFEFAGRNGRRIHSFLALPPGFDETRKYPLFVLIHGGHASMWRDAITYRWNYHLLGQPGFVVLMTDYRGSTGYGERFTLDILGDPLAGPAEDINDAADEAIKRFPFIDGARQAAGGASYGGHLTNWLAGTTTRYKALVSHAGLATLDMQWATSDAIYHREIMMGGPYWENPARWIEQSPLARAGRFSTPMLISIGVNDYRVPEGNSLAMFAALQRMNVPSRLLVWPDENHWILKGENSRVFYREVRAWLEKYLPPQTNTEEHRH